MSISTQPAEAAIDPLRWPGVVGVPDNPARAAIAEWLFYRAVRTLPIRVTTADGRRSGAGTAADPDLHLIRPADFYQRLAGARPDRLRRVLHGRRLGIATTWPACSPCWPAGCRR